MSDGAALIVLGCIAVGALVWLLTRSLRVLKRTKKLAQYSDENYRLLVEGATGFAIIRLNFDGRVSMWNAGAERMIGYSEKEICGEHFTIFFTPEDRAAGRPERELVMARAAEKADDDNWLVRKDGTRFWASGAMTALRDERGNLQGYAKIVRDVTERKMNEEKLRASEAEFRATFEQSSVGKAQLDAKTARFIHVNKKFCEMTGYSAEELAEMRPADLDCTGEDVADAAEHGKLLEGEITFFQTEKRYLRKDGESIWVHINIALLRDADGLPERTIAVFQDISARKLAEEALQESQQFTRRVLDNLVAFVGVMTPDGTLIEINRAPLDASGISADDVLGKKFWECHWWNHSATLGTQMQAWCEQAARGETIRSDVQIRLNGEVRAWIDFQLAPLTDDEGQITHIIPSAMEISERREMETALRTSEERLRMAHKASRIGTFDWDMQSGVNTWSPELEAMYGLALGEFGKTITSWAQLVYSEDREAAVGLVNRAIETGKAIEGEWRVKWQDGTIHWIFGRFQAVSDDAGEPARLTGVNIDITGRKETEEKLRAAHDSFRQLVEHSPFGVYAVNADFQLVKVSLGAQKVFENVQPLLGRDLAEILREIWTEPFASEAISIFREVLESGEPYHAPSSIAQRNDITSTEAYDWKVERMLLSDGRPGVVCHFYDLTEREHFQAMLRESDTRMRVATGATAVGIWEWNVLTNTMRWDAQIFRIYGIPPMADGLVTYALWSEAVLPEDLAESERVLQDTMRRQGESKREFRIRRRDDGEVRVIEAVETVRTNARGETEWVVGTNLDITERKRSREALIEAKEQAEAGSRAKDNFLATLSHELRTPLTPVLMAATALAGDSSLPPDVREQLEMMRRNIELEARLIDDLLDLTRIIHGKFSIERVPADVHDLLHHTDEIIRSDGLGKHLRIIMQLDAKHHHALADPARLQQVFWNLLRNAVKFTPDGGKITVHTYNDAQGRIVISVADDGIGIRAEILAQIFDAFNQGDIGQEHRYAGLGLGLAISKAIISAHGGVIKAESGGSGNGAIFTVALDSVSAPAAPSKKNPQLAESGSSLALLVVEDHEATRTVLERLLKHNGHQVTSASNLQDALTAFTTSHFDAIISDLGLPDGSGFDLMERVQKIRAVPAIALSGYGMEGDLQRTKEAGFFAHLVKPVKIDQLLQLLAQVPLGSDLVK